MGFMSKWNYFRPNCYCLSLLCKQMKKYNVINESEEVSFSQDKSFRYVSMWLFIHSEDRFYMFTKLKVVLSLPAMEVYIFYWFSFACHRSIHFLLIFFCLPWKYTFFIDFSFACHGSIHFLVLFLFNILEVILDFYNNDPYSYMYIIYPKYSTLDNSQPENFLLCHFSSLDISQPDIFHLTYVFYLKKRTKYKCYIRIYCSIVICF